MSSVIHSLNSISSLGLFSGDMNGTTGINNITEVTFNDTNNINNFSLSRRPLLTVSKVSSQIVDNYLNLNIIFKHIFKTKYPYMDYKYYITIYISNQIVKNKTVFTISDPNKISQTQFSYTYQNSFETDFVKGDKIKFKIEFDNNINIGSTFTTNFLFLTPNFLIGENYNFGSLGLFSGDMNGDDLITPNDTNNINNYSLSRRPILSLVGINHTYNDESNEITSNLKFAHLHKSKVKRSFKYSIIPIVNGSNQDETVDMIIPEQTEENNSYYYNFEHKLQFDVSIEHFTPIQYKIMYKYTEDNNFAEEIYPISDDLTDSEKQNMISKRFPIYSTNFEFVTPSFASFDLAPNFTSVRYENNASIIAILDENELKIKEKDRLVVLDSEDNIISYASLNIPKKIPKLNISEPYYFAGVIGLTSNSVTAKYKYWNFQYKKLYDLKHSSDGVDPTSISADSIIGTPNDPVIFTIN